MTSEEESSSQQSKSKRHDVCPRCQSINWEEWADRSEFPDNGSIVLELLHEGDKVLRPAECTLCRLLEGIMPESPQGQPCYLKAVPSIIFCSGVLRCPKWAQGFSACNVVHFAHHDDHWKDFARRIAWPEAGCLAITTHGRNCYDFEAVSQSPGID